MAQKENRVKIEFGEQLTILTFQDESILEDVQIKKLEQALLPIIKEKGEHKVVLNFGNVRYMSSAFLGLLVKVHKRIIDLHGHLQLCNLDPKIHKVFEITQLTKIFDIAPREQG
jgi:anti-anti-sigma factor